MNVCQELPEGPTGPHLWTQETQPEGRRWCSAEEGAVGAHMGGDRTGKGEKQEPVSPVATGNFQGEEPDTEGSNVLCRS